MVRFLILYVWMRCILSESRVIRLPADELLCPRCNFSSFILKVVLMCVRNSICMRDCLSIFVYPCQVCVLHLLAGLAYVRPIMSTQGLYSAATCWHFVFCATINVKFIYCDSKDGRSKLRLSFSFSLCSMCFQVEIGTGKLTNCIHGHYFVKIWMAAKTCLYMRSVTSAADWFCWNWLFTDWRVECTVYVDACGVRTVVRLLRLDKFFLT